MSLLRRRMMMAKYKPQGWYSDGDINLTEYGTYRLTSLSDDKDKVATAIIATFTNGDRTNLPGNWNLYYQKNTNFIITFSEKYFAMFVDNEVVFEANTEKGIAVLSFRRGAGTVNYHATINFYVEKIS